MNLDDYKKREQEENEKKITQAVKLIRQSPDLDSTISKVAEVAGLTRQTVAKYPWVKQQLKEIKDKRTDLLNKQKEEKVREINEVKRLKGDLLKAKESIARVNFELLEIKRENLRLLNKSKVQSNIIQQKEKRIQELLNRMSELSGIINEATDPASNIIELSEIRKER